MWTSCLLPSVKSVCLCAPALCMYLLLSPITVTAGDDPSAPEATGSFNLYFENDLFAGTDRHYTNGTKISWISPDLSRYRDSEDLPEWALPWIRRLPFINEPGLQRNIALCIGQSMYTPEKTHRRDLVPDDRPYAGWAYGGIAFHSKNNRRLDTIEIQAGIIGPLSFAEETQTQVHRLRGIPVPRGWEHQLHNEPGLLIIYERKHRIFQREWNGWGLDAITHLGAGLGNVATYANTGIEVRAGWNLPADFGAALIRPAGDTNAPVRALDSRLSGNGRFSVHLFGAISGRAVLRDVFLDGNTFTSSHSVNKEPVVADVSAGICMEYGRYKLSYAQVVRSREFERQREHHSFGSITLTVAY